MTKQESKAARAVMEAWENGEEIEYNHTLCSKEWRTVENAGELNWNFSLFEYRIKPKEKIVYVNLYLDDKIGLCASVHHDKDDAIKMSGVPKFTKQLAIATPITVVL